MQRNIMQNNNNSGVDDMSSYIRECMLQTIQTLMGVIFTA
jgi:hypothetical protein